MVSTEEEYISQIQKLMNRYAPLTDDSFSRLRSLMRFRTVEKGEYLLHVNQVAKKIYIVCKGVLASLFITTEGGTHIKNFFLEGNFAASTVSLLLSSPSAFGIQALENSVVIEMNFNKYRQLIHEKNDLKHFYISYLEQKWIIENEKRQIAFATQTASERYLTFLKEYPSLEKRIAQLHIASYLGITPTQLSRIRKSL